MNDGLEVKYTVTHKRGEPVNPDHVFFVLNLTTDPGARLATLAYADYVEGEFPRLASELREQVAREGLRG